MVMTFRRFTSGAHCICEQLRKLVPANARPRLSGLAEVMKSFYKRHHHVRRHASIGAERSVSGSELSCCRLRAYQPLPTARCSSE